MDWSMASKHVGMAVNVSGQSTLVQPKLAC